jgi:hypothetical protein
MNYTIFAETNKLKWQKLHTVNRQNMCFFILIKNVVLPLSEINV